MCNELIIDPLFANFTLLNVHLLFYIFWYLFNRIVKSRITSDVWDIVLLFSCLSDVQIFRQHRNNPR